MSNKNCIVCKSTKMSNENYDYANKICNICIDQGTDDKELLSFANKLQDEKTETVHPVECESCGGTGTIMEESWIDNIQFDSAPCSNCHTHGFLLAIWDNDFIKFIKYE